jgi:hypothetical protein
MARKRPGRSTLAPLPSLLQNLPPDTRRMAGDGLVAVAKGTWRNPDDIQPNALHKPREITGYRTFCPLRKMQRHGSAIEDTHIHAADRLRLVVDLAVIGPSGLRMLLLVSMQSAGFGPTTGPTRNAVRQAEAWKEAVRMLRVFTPNQRSMLSEIVLLNRSIPKWCALTGVKCVKRETGKLIAILDILASRYASEIQRDLDTGRILAA